MFSLLMISSLSLSFSPCCIGRYWNFATWMYAKLKEAQPNPAHDIWLHLHKQSNHHSSLPLSPSFPSSTKAPRAHGVTMPRLMANSYISPLLSFAHTTHNAHNTQTGIDRRWKDDRATHILHVTGHLASYIDSLRGFFDIKGNWSVW